MSIHFIYQVTIEVAIINALPTLGKWLPGGAQSAIIKDPSLPERLNFLPGIGLYLGWTLTLLTIGLILAQHSPQPPTNTTN